MQSSPNAPLSDVRPALALGPRLARAAGHRLAPILMTALVTGIALLPLLTLGRSPGGKIEQPMALVIVGGLASSTWLNLLVVPLWYARAARGRAVP